MPSRGFLLVWVRYGPGARRGWEQSRRRARRTLEARRGRQRTGDQQQRDRSTDEVSPGEVGLDPLVAFRQRLDNLQPGDLDNLGLASKLTNGVEAIAVLGPLKAEAFDLLAGQPRAKWAGHFLADRAQ